MYLKTLELQGFKSFPDKTVIEFDKGMTAIVGANGSGKSNISDAVRWVLGEMSAKSLRGSKMEDVIFNGSSGRKPASFAEVVMTIDNSDYLMKIDYDEVSVGRRLYRSGESEYYLNKKQVRLKDVVDLFLNTGIGREGYSVISQGKIAEIISLKGNERRELFEEAAGISRFRYRKHEAGLKLQSVTENALRINDILSEVQGRLPRLEAQSAKAKAYLAIAEEKKRLEIGIWAKRLDRLERFSREGGERYALEDKALTELSRTIAEEDRRIDALYVESQEKNLQTELLRGEVTSLASEDAEESRQLSVLENEIHHMDLKKEEILSLGQENDVREKELLEQKALLEASFASVQEELDGIEARFEENRTAQASLSEAYLALVDREEAALTEKDGLGQKKAALSLEKKEGEGFAIAALEQKKELEARLLGGSEKDEALRLRLDEVRLAAQKAAEERVEAEKENGELNLDLYRLGEEIEEKSELLQKARMEKMDAEQRRDTLLRMERLLEGFSDSVKEVMSASGSELEGICGPVSKLIETDEAYVLAVETALGGSVQNLVVEDEKSAKAAIAFLKENRLGRATFLPLTTLRTARYDISGIHQDGFLGLACDFCRSEEKYRPAVEFLLGKTLLCRDLESATRLAKAEKYGVRIVTLDGQIIHAGSSFTGGQALSLSGALSRTGDLAKLKSTVSSLEERIKGYQNALDELEAQRTEKRRLARESEARLDQARKTEGEAKNAFLLETERVDAARSDYANIEVQILEIGTKLVAREERSRAIDAELEALFARDGALLEEIARMREEKEKMEAEREELILAQGEILALRGRAQLRLEQEALRLSENEESIRLLAEGVKNKEALLRDLEEKKKETLSGIEESRAKREAILLGIEEKKGAIALLQGRVSEAGEEIAA
ncbi:MAG: chromosome segregation protein SMC, partial [Clostridia bacterium]|nr:chromosome segregation protein SMC [Clostridia bacterium]